MKNLINAAAFIRGNTVTFTKTIFQNERVLSSQALDVGRSLGQGLGRAKSITVQTRRNLLSTRLFRDITSIVVWKPAIGEKLQADQELDNVVKNNEIVGHFPRECSRILWYFIAHGGKICVELTGRRRHCKLLCRGMEIPCRLVLSCSSKVKINRLKELVESKIRR